MADSAQLLRLLEPVIRPDGHGRVLAPRPEALPIEARSFESLLEQATRVTQEATTVGEAGAAAPAKPTQMLGPLAQVDQVDNVSLRALMNGRP